MVFKTRKTSSIVKIEKSGSLMKVNQDIMRKLENMRVLLEKDFPSEDIERIEHSIFQDDDKCCLTGDYDSFCSLISGSLSYVLA